MTAKGPVVESSAQLDRLAHAVLGAAIEVHRQLGPGFLEGVYEEALAVELELQRLPCQRQKSIQLRNKNRAVGQARLDLFVGSSLVVELKTVDALLPIHKAQVISYLKATGCSLRLLINFNVDVLRKGLQRVILTS